MVDVRDCVSGTVCEKVLCAPGEYCLDQRYCVNITATATARS